ncbi:hypothetical protein COCOBI_15-3200 [Coccomyxa sp. Obi]|nr:hypothetical protein COCOBI_15-3200 [Coccomyxa sp. Obi]
MNPTVLSNRLSRPIPTQLNDCGFRALNTIHRKGVQAAGKARNVWALAYPRTEQRQTAGRPLEASFSRGSAKQRVHDSSISDRAVMYLGSDSDVAGRTLFLHLRPGVTVGQVVAVCNELAGRVQDGQRQLIKATTRPVSFTTPSARVDWDPVNEELPAHMWTLLGAEVHSLKLSMISVTVESEAELNQLRRHLTDIVNYIENIDFDRIPLSGSI